MKAMSNLNSVETLIEVDGKPCDFLYMYLDQFMTDHHRFEIGVNYNHLKPSVWIETPQTILGQLAKNVYIKMTHRQSGEVNEFNGVVSDIDIVGTEGDPGMVVLKGGDPTVLLDRDPAMGAFTDYTLHNIVGEILEQSGVKVDVENKPAFENKIPYLARYKETSYAFLARVLSSFGEWFYYDGRKLIVGNPRVIENKDIFYDIEMKSLKMSTCVRNLNIELYDYNPTENDYLENNPPQNIDGVNPFMQVARKQSDPLYPTPTKLPTDRAMLFEKDMTRSVREFHSRNYSKMMIFEGTTTTCAIRLGEYATAIVPKSFGGVTQNDLGRYRVIEIHHRVEQDGTYSNTFKGLVGMTEALPVDNIVQPVAFPEPAIVVDNDDPRKQGRVKVRYYWQDEDDKMAATNWIRVQSPDAGSSDQVSTNRGLWFIPEKDDQVMIGFEKGDPSRPYVMGSLFHRDNTKGIAKDNTIRAITTKSGHILEFNDDEGGGWGITLKDRDGNLMQIDSSSGDINITATKNVNITAGETMTLTAKELNIDVQENMTTSVGKDQTTSVGGKVENSAKEISEAIAENATVNVGKKLTETTGDTQMTSGGDFVVSADGKALIKGAQDARVSKG